MSYELLSYERREGQGQMQNDTGKLSWYVGPTYEAPYRTANYIG